MTKQPSPFKVGWLLTALVACGPSFGFSIGPAPGLNCSGLLACTAAQLLPFYESVHQDITQNALSSVIYKPPGTTTSVKFQGTSVTQVVDGNFNTDYTQDDPTLHFDDEQLSQSVSSLASRRAGILSQLQDSTVMTESDAQIWREVLGQSLHTVQDFFAHSNWVDQHSKESAPRVWETGQLILVNPAPSAVVCDLGHSNLIGSSTIVTSGYAIGNLELGEAPDGKCSHGLIGNGIHKDNSSRTKFEPAKSLATSATVQYTTDLFNAPGVNPDNVCMLMTGSPCLILKLSSVANLDIGNSVTIGATATDISGDPLPLPANLGWGSSNPSVATVTQSGLVTAILTGTATITVTDPVTGTTASVSITVNPTSTASNSFVITTVVFSPTLDEPGFGCTFTTVHTITLSINLDDQGIPFGTWVMDWQLSGSGTFDDNDQPGTGCGSGTDVITGSFFPQITGNQLTASGYFYDLQFRINATIKGSSIVGSVTIEPETAPPNGYVTITPSTVPFSL